MPNKRDRTHSPHTPRRVYLLNNYFHFCLKNIPGWSLIFCSLGLFVYQSLDAIDGKQARRTNSSTPLGELFDHGCDAVSTG